MPSQLSISNARMLLLMKDAIYSGIADNEKDFCIKIGFTQFTNLPKVKSGASGFTVDQIKKACQLTGANANWVLGLERNKKRLPPNDALAMIRAGLESLEEKGREKKK